MASRNGAMWHNMRFRSDRENAGVVAAALVCTIAAVGLAGAVILATRSSEGLVLSGGVLATGFAVSLVVLLVGRKLSSTEQSIWSFFRKPDAGGQVEYVPKLRRSRRATTGSHTPPTVEELHELKQNVNTWVPSGKLPRQTK
jgi:hypothetical protein